MSYPKVIKDWVYKALMPKGIVPQGVVEILRYGHSNGPIKFNYRKGEAGSIIAESENFRYGVIITSAGNSEELDRNIKDAILTAFDIPSSYSKEVSISRVGEEKLGYAIA